MFLLRLKKALFCGVFFFFGFFLTCPALAVEPELTARAAILMDARTGRVLFAKNPYEQLPQASTTKITTAILALEKGRLEDQVVVSQYAAETPESSIWLEAGEVLSLDELLYALMMQSANDAATAIAEHVGGSEANFVEMMNQKAQELGCLHTHYENPHGLHAAGHYTCAYDLALLARHAYTYPEFRQIVTTERKVLPWLGKLWSRVLYNKNRLVAGPAAYSGADGVKTGYTKEAGSCLVGSATRDGWQLIAVVLNSPPMYNEVKMLLDYGYQNYKPVLLVHEGQYIRSLTVSRGEQPRVGIVAADGAVVPLRPGEENRVTQSVSLARRLSAPVKQGDPVGEIMMDLDGQPLTSIKLVTATTVERKSWWRSILLTLVFLLLGRNVVKKIVEKRLEE